MVDMNITVLDTVSGKKVESRDSQFNDCSVWWWTEGNGGCDCNRAILFPEIDEEMDAKMRSDHPEIESHYSYCYGEKRFLIINVDLMPEGYTLADFNDGYPDKLLRKFGII